MLNLYIGRSINPEAPSILYDRDIRYLEHYANDDDYLQKCYNRDAILDIDYVYMYSGATGNSNLILLENNEQQWATIWNTIADTASRCNETTVAGWHIFEHLACLHNWSIARGISVPLWACNVVDKAYNTVNAYDYFNLYKNGSYKNSIDLFEAAYLWSNRDVSIIHIGGERGLSRLFHSDKPDKLDIIKESLKKAFVVFERAASLHNSPG